MESHRCILEKEDSVTCVTTNKFIQFIKQHTGNLSVRVGEGEKKVLLCSVFARSKLICSCSYLLTALSSCDKVCDDKKLGIIAFWVILSHNNQGIKKSFQVDTALCQKI